MRLCTRRFVSRHFQRPFYDYRTVWRQFTAGDRPPRRAAELCVAIVKFISEIFQALSVTVWLVEKEQGSAGIGGFHVALRGSARELELEPAETAQIIARS